MQIKRRKKRKTKRQYTKIAVTLILIVSLIDLQLPYVLAFLGRENTLEDLSKTILIQIIVVFFVYCLKSYFETNAEKKNERTKEYEKEIDES